MKFNTSISNGVAELTLAVNSVNAFDIETTFELGRQISSLGRNPDVKVLVLRNEGKAFCVGADVKELNRDASLVRESNKAWLDLTTACHDCEVPVIAVVDGYCIGGGLALAASCDIIFISDRSTFSLPQIKVGAWGAGTFLMRLLGPMKIRSIMMTGRSISARELASGGCIEAVLPVDELLPAARNIATDIAGHSGEALRMGKAALNGIELLDIRHSYRFEQGFTTELYISQEAKQRRQAHLDSGFQ